MRVALLSPVPTSSSCLWRNLPCSYNFFCLESSPLQMCKSLDRVIVTVLIMKSSNVSNVFRACTADIQSRFMDEPPHVIEAETGAPLVFCFLVVIFLTMRVHKLEESTSHKTKLVTSRMAATLKKKKNWLWTMAHLCFLELCVEKGCGLLDCPGKRAKVHGHRREVWRHLRV